MMRAAALPGLEVASHGAAGRWAGSHGCARAVRAACWPNSRGDVYALASKAHLQAQLGDRRAALQTLRATGGRSNPDNGRHWFNYGFLLEELGEYGQAEAAFRRATELSPELDRAWYGLGLVLIRLQRFDEAAGGPEEEHPIATHEPVWLVPAGAGSCRPARTRRGAEDHPPPQEVRAQSGRSAGTRDGDLSSRPPAEGVFQARPGLQDRRRDPPAGRVVSGGRNARKGDIRRQQHAIDRRTPRVLAEEPDASPQSCWRSGSSSRSSWATTPAT